MTGLIAIVAVLLSGIGASDEVGVTVWRTAMGFLGVSLGAMVVTLLIYFVRIWWLCVMYSRKRRIVKRVRSGEYVEAVRIGEEKQWCFEGNYVKNPEKLSKSVALALSYALERVGREREVRRVRSASRARNQSRW